ncbi:MAG: hypothetical protein ACXABY_21780 [Candidatus Thorarchaeota archaeon]|jgi:hypothetical protein
MKLQGQVDCLNPTCNKKIQFFFKQTGSNGRFFTNCRKCGNKTLIIITTQEADAVDDKVTLDLTTKKEEASAAERPTTPVQADAGSDSKPATKPLDSVPNKADASSKEKDELAALFDGLGGEEDG